MFRLGLTGSIATGKSTVLSAFAALGVPVYSADAAVHELYEGEAVAAVEKLFPGVSRNGRIDRDRLSGMLAETPSRLAELEAAVHPLVRAKMRSFLQSAERGGAALAVLEIPLLFETGGDYPLDAVAATACSDETQRRRALARPGMTVDKFRTILARQMPQAEKRRRADFVIDTDTDLAATRAQVADLVGRLMQQQTGQAN